MSDKNINVPQGMLDAANGTCTNEACIKAALRCLEDYVDNPTDTLFHRAILEAEEKRYPGDNKNLNIISYRVAFEYGVAFARGYISRMFFEQVPADDREMTVYDCLDCKKSWKQQLREEVASCVYCQSSNTKSIATVYPVREYTIAPKITKTMCPLCLGSGIDNHANEPKTPFDSRFVACGYCKGEGFVVSVALNIPEEIKELLLSKDASDYSRPTREFYNNAVLKAYQIGKESSR